MAAEIPDWTFMTNHAHVLFCLAQDPTIRQRKIAERVGITERAVQRIVAELEQSLYITRVRQGRRNSYVVNKDKFMRREVVSHCSVADLLNIVVADRPAPEARPQA